MSVQYGRFWDIHSAVDAASVSTGQCETVQAIVFIAPNRWDRTDAAVLCSLSVDAVPWRGLERGDTLQMNSVLWPTSHRVHGELTRGEMSSVITGVPSR